MTEKKHHPAVVEYIEKELEKEIPIEHIKKALLDVGHDAEIIDASITHTFKKQKRHRRVVGGIIICIIIAVIAGVFLLTPIIEPMDEKRNKTPIHEGINTTTTTSVTVKTTTTTLTRLKKDILKFKNNQCTQIADQGLKEHCNFYLNYCENATGQVKIRCEDIQKNLEDLELS